MSCIHILALFCLFLSVRHTHDSLRVYLLCAFCLFYQSNALGLRNEELHELSRFFFVFE